MNHESLLSRRNMLAGAAGLGCFLAGGAAAQGAEHGSGALRVGLLGLPGGADSITEASARWSDLNVSVSHVWDSDADRARAFADRGTAVQVVERFDQMVGVVDGVVLGDDRATAWNHQLAGPYLEARTPVWIDGPLAYSMTQARQLVEAAKREDTPLAASCVEELLPLTRLLGRKAKSLAPITAATAVVNTRGRRNHRWAGYEAVSVACAIFGTNVRKIARIVAEAEEPTHTITLEYANQPPMHAAVHGLPGDDNLVWARFYGTNLVDEGHAAGDAVEQDWDRTYLPAALAMQRMFRAKQLPESYEALLAKARLYLAACRSSLSPDGKEFEVAALADDWTAENPYPRHISRL